MPALFVVASAIFIFQSIADKLLITYYYKERVEHNDLLNRSALKAIKYALFMFLFTGGFAMASNYCTLENVSREINFSNESLVCLNYWVGPQILISTSAFFLCFFVTMDLLQKDKSIEKFKIRKEEDSNYFNRLSNVDRKRWIAEEQYRRENYAIRTLSDEVMDLLRLTPGQRYKQSNDPYGYDILADISYLHDL